LIAAARIAARYDLMIMSCKDMSVTAARELVDQTCARFEVPLYILHDFDVSGFSIAATLHRSNRRYQFATMFKVIDFGLRLDAALAAFPSVLARILPGGKRIGKEIVALNPRRADRNLGSFKVNRYNGKWADFATGHPGGDPVSLVAYVADVSQVEAAHLLARMLGLETGGRRNG
jgi:hypothetical protein